MRRHALMITVALAAFAAAAPAVASGTLYQLPMVSGSTETIAFGVNDNLVVTGFWLDSNNVENGFVGPADGTKYKTFNDDGSAGTQPRGISPKGLITGIDNVGSGDPTQYIPYVRSRDGTITDVTMNGSPLNYLVQGINIKGTFTGSYEDNSGNIFGYTGKNAQFVRGIKLRGVQNIAVAGRGMNDEGDIVGWYEDTSGLQHGFLKMGSTVTTIDNPNGATNLEGINNKGLISGLYTDSSGNRHGFTYNIAKQKFKELTVPGSTFVEVWGLNDDGVVAIDGQDPSTGLFVGYLYCPSLTVCPGGAGVRHALPVLRHAPRTPLTLP